MGRVFLDEIIISNSSGKGKSEESTEFKRVIDLPFSSSQAEELFLLTTFPM